MPSACQPTPNLLFKKIIPYYLRSFHTNHINVRNVEIFKKQFKWKIMKKSIESSKTLFF